MTASPDGVAVLDATGGPPLPILDGQGSAYAVVWPGTGAQLRSLARIRLGVGARTVVLRHPGEAVYYVIDGTGAVSDEDAGDDSPLVAGAMVHVDPGTGYRLRAGDRGLDVVGGPSPADPALYGG